MQVLDDFTVRMLDPSNRNTQKHGCISLGPILLKA